MNTYTNYLNLDSKLFFFSFFLPIWIWLFSVFTFLFLIKRISNIIPENNYRFLHGQPNVNVAFWTYLLKLVCLVLFFIITVCLVFKTN